MAAFVRSPQCWSLSPPFFFFFADLGFLLDCFASRRTPAVVTSPPLASTSARCASICSFGMAAIFWAREASFLVMPISSSVIGSAILGGPCVGPPFRGRPDPAVPLAFSIPASHVPCMCSASITRRPQSLCAARAILTPFVRRCAPFALSFADFRRSRSSARTAWSKSRLIPLTMEGRLDGRFAGTATVIIDHHQSAAREAACPRLLLPPPATARSLRLPAGAAPPRSPAASPLP